MSDIEYSWASWRIEIVKGAFVVVHVKGCPSDTATAAPADVVRAGKVLNDVAVALGRVREKWNSPKAEGK